MIQAQTILNVADNTGAKELMCIKVLGNNRNCGEVGDIIIASVKSAMPNMPIKKSSIVRAIVVRTKRRIRRKDGSCLHFSENAAVIVNAENNPKGTRIFGPIAKEVRDKNFTKIVSLASEIV